MWSTSMFVGFVPKSTTHLKRNSFTLSAEWDMFWTSRHPRSLALRLSAWYAGSAFLLLAAGTGFLYWVMVQNSNAQDDQYLWEKVNTLGKLLNQHDAHTL